MKAQSGKDMRPVIFFNTEVGIYKRKQVSKKARKQELDQESDQEKKILLFLGLLGRILGRVLENKNTRFRP